MEPFVIWELIPWAFDLLVNILILWLTLRKEWDKHKNRAYTHFPIVNLERYLTNTATIFLISISKVQFSNCSTDPTDNIIQTELCHGLKTIKAFIQQIGYVFKLIFTRMFL